MSAATVERTIWTKHLNLVDTDRIELYLGMLKVGMARCIASRENLDLTEKQPTMITDLFGGACPNV